MTHRDFRALPPLTQEELRRRAVQAVVEGLSQADAARVFQVGRQAVNRWYRAHRQGGEAALAAQPRGTKTPQRKLTPAQAAEVRAAVRAHSPEQLGLPFVLWTRAAVAGLIEQRLGIRLAQNSVGRYLARWGFTPQKPLSRAYPRDPDAIRLWLEVTYPAIVRRANAERAVIHWGDEMGLRSDDHAGRSFAPRGHTPEVGATGKRFGCNVLSTLTNRGELSFKVFTQRFTGRVFIDFLRRLIRHASQPVVLIVDNHPVHHATRVAEWVAAHAQRIRLEFLPGYAPELNPDELLNHDVKANAIGRRRPKDQAEMVDNVRGYLRRRQNQPHLVRKFFHELHVRYAAP
jgi:transposase